jgi:hypothetical protein
MPTTEHTTAGGTRRTYRYEIGPIDYDGKDVNAVVILGMPLEGGQFVDLTLSVLVARILADNPDISTEPAVWAVFVKSPRDMPVAEWRFAGSGSGRRQLSENERLFDDIPESVLRQLEEIFGP